MLASELRDALEQYGDMPVMIMVESDMGGYVTATDFQVVMTADAWGKRYAQLLATTGEDN